MWLTSEAPLKKCDLLGDIKSDLLGEFPGTGFFSSRCSLGLFMNWCEVKAGWAEGLWWPPNEPWNKHRRFTNSLIWVLSWSFMDHWELWFLLSRSLLFLKKNIKKILNNDFFVKTMQKSILNYKRRFYFTKNLISMNFW